jgi:hypothetical protein
VVIWIGNSKKIIKVAKKMSLTLGYSAKNLLANESFPVKEDVCHPSYLSRLIPNKNNKIRKKFGINLDKYDGWQTSSLIGKDSLASRFLAE